MTAATSEDSNTSLRMSLPETAARASITVRSQLCLHGHHLSTLAVGAEGPMLGKCGLHAVSETWLHTIRVKVGNKLDHVKEAYLSSDWLLRSQEPLFLGHNTPLPLERSAPASFKRLLGATPRRDRPYRSLCLPQMAPFM